MAAVAELLALPHFLTLCKGTNKTMKKLLVLLAAFTLAAPVIQAQTALAVYQTRMENDVLRKRVIGSYIIASAAINKEATNTPNFAVRQRILSAFQRDPLQNSEKLYTGVIAILHEANQLTATTDGQILTAVNTFFGLQVTIAVATGNVE